MVFGAETVAENGGEGTGFDNGVTEGVVFVVGGGGAGFGDVVGDVSVVVVEGEVVGVVDADGEEGGDAAGALEGAGEVFAPDVFEFVGGAVGVGDGF